MRILLTRLTNDRHALEIVRKDGTRERAELETKSLWLHDLIHLAVEAEAGVQDGFWGSLATGTTLAAMNGRAEEGMKVAPASMLAIEMLVGALTGVLKGAPEESAAENIRAYLAQVGKAELFPPWLTPEFVARVRERLRRLVGQWNGTPFGATMEVEWLDA